MSASLEGYDPMDPRVQQDPFPYYEALREHAPVWRAASGIYLVSQHAAVREVLEQPNLFSSQWGNTAGPPPIAVGDDEMLAIYAEGYPPVSTMLTLDPPLQTRYRKAVGRAFTVRRVQAMEPRIRRIAIDLIESWPRTGHVDFMAQMSVPFPVRVISHALSIPASREGDVKRWSDDSVSAIGVEIARERALEAGRGIVEMQKCLATLVEDRQQNPRDDFLSELTASQFEDAEGRLRPLDVPEILSILQQLMVAGNEATTKGINEIVKLLVERPDQWQKVQRDPALIPAIAEEGLRLASPNQGLFRVSTEDTEVAGTPIPKGSMLWVMFGSANRDARVFPDPDRFDPSRTNLNDVVTFGRGAHFCIGAPLARLEIRVLLEELAKRVESWGFSPGMSFEYEPSFILRGLKRLDLDVIRKAHLEDASR
jgi:cytochrome P450